ncbi:MAG TPA: class I tRNA ligase family protein, partial [Pyrinomonadaceae bacterium]|nr:class I tRNA ligase family protein [Pyrinomonadaceae bacterium]
DAWYKREARELLPDGFKCRSCGSNEFTKETDILDVWFDSGSSSIAVLENREGLRWPADVYIEGGDQFRGWFNSSLMVGLAVHDRAPYDAVLTHGWTLDAQGKAMHKSLGNAVSPDEIIPKLGAEVLRLWCASADYMEDLRCSDEILQRVTDGYRKLRNTARFALGNLYDFEPERDSVVESEMLEIDRWALAELNETVWYVRDWYERYGFHDVFHTLYDFCTVTLSARYFDIIKDRLYTAAPKSNQRRSAQTVLYRIANELSRMLAPILSFTAEEIWEYLPSSDKRARSVHLTELSSAHDRARDRELLARWNKLFSIRDQVLLKLEEARVAKRIGSSLQACVVIRPRHDDEELIRYFWDELRYIFIVSQVRLAKDKELRGGSLVLNQFGIDLAQGQKCERCWNYSTRVGESSRYPTVCERCVEALVEIEAG